jgi:hypothetical protein
MKKKEHSPQFDKFTWPINRKRDPKEKTKSMLILLRSFSQVTQVVEFQKRPLRTYYEAAGQPFVIGQAQVEYGAAQYAAGYAGYAQGGYAQTGLSQTYASPPVVQPGFLYGQTGYPPSTTLSYGATGFGATSYGATGYGAAGYGAAVYDAGIPALPTPALQQPAAFSGFPAGFSAPYSPRPTLQPVSHPSLPSLPVYQGAAPATGIPPLAPASNYDTIPGYPTGNLDNAPSHYPLNIPSYPSDFGTEV